jgi:Tfp pilus assembly protein PilX
MTKSKSDPRIVIEETAFVPDDLTKGGGTPSMKYYYRVTSGAVGGTDTATSVVQTTFTRRF